MTKPQNDPLVPFDWFPGFPAGNEKGPPSVLFALGQAAVGLGVAAFLYYLGHWQAAAVVLSICLVIGTASVVSESARVGIQRFFVRLGVWLGKIAGFILLAPIFYLCFSVVHLFSRLSGRDPLDIRARNRQSHWVASDSVNRKVRYASGMFATEQPHHAKKPWLIPVLLVVALLIGSELALRSLGLGNPVLYRNDPHAGYFPEPNQQVVRKGRTITINSHGMRAPDYPLAKSPDTFRVLMLGDSTLWGGTFLDQEDIYARILERRLQKVVDDRGGAGHVEVWNMGVNGWGPFHELGYVERFGVFDADLAIVCLPITDIYRPLYYLMMQPFCEVNHPPRFAWEEVASTLIWRYRNQRIHHFEEEDKAVLAEQGIDAYARLGRFLKDAGCEVRFEILPSLWAGTTEKTPPNEQVLVDQFMAVLGNSEWAVQFPAGLFVGKGAAEDLYKDGIHLEWLGNDLYAGYLTEQLLSGSPRFEAFLAATESGELPGSADQRSMR